MAVFKRLPDQFFSDASAPYANGYLYIGVYGSDPVANPITIYTDESQSSTLANPQRLDEYGRPVNDIYVFADYSYTIKDSALNQVENKSLRLPPLKSEVTTNATNIATNAADIVTNATNIALKADKVSGATNGNFAGLDAIGNLTDSGKKPADYQPAATRARTDLLTHEVILDTSELPVDNSVPLITEGEEVASVALTPAAIGEKIRVHGQALCNNDTTGKTVGLAVFADSTCIGAVAEYDSASGAYYIMSFDCEYTATDTVEVDFSFRIGGSGDGDTGVRINGAAGPVFDGIALTFIEAQILE